MFKQHAKTSNAKPKILSTLAIIGSVVAASPVFGAMLPLKGNHLSLLAAITITALSVLNNKSLAKIKFFPLLFIAYLTILALAAVNSLYWGAATFTVSIYFLSATIIGKFMTDDDLEEYVKMLTTVLFVVLIGAVAGYIYATLGGHALLTIENPDGRNNYLFFTTFSNATFGQFIRPSGIFDEPGALSFFTCLTVASREALRMPRQGSVWLLTLGTITGSLAHLLFFAAFLFHFLLEKNRTMNAVSLLTATITIGFAALLFLHSSKLQLLLDFYQDRLQFLDGRFAGDNRTDLFVNALSYLDTKTIIWGLDVNCILQTIACNPDQYLKYGENPLTMLVQYGLFLALPYYMVTFYITFKAIKGKNFLIFGVLLLLLQRPYVMNFGYSISIAIYIFILINADNICPARYKT